MSADIPIRYVQELPELLTVEDYMTEDKEKQGERKVRIRICTTAQGVEILGDSMYPGELEALFSKLNAPEIEMVLCG